MDRLQRMLEFMREKHGSEPETPEKAPGRTFFVDPAGVHTLTNRPELYRGRKGYREMVIEYDPIVVPDRFKKMDSAADYSTSEIAYLVRRYAQQYGLDKHLVYAVMKAESNFNPYAVSEAGARGLMQVMPGTAEEMGVTNLFDPAQNIAAGTQYLAKMLTLFDGNLRLALAAYNAGPEAVKRNGDVPPFPETRRYIDTVQQYCRQFRDEGVRPAYLAKAQARESSFLPGGRRKYHKVHFKSGYTQSADRVIDKNPYYVLTFRGRSYTVRKSLVAKVEKPS